MKPEDITFVFQGQEFFRGGINCTLNSLIKTRKLFPFSEIILSTWREIDEKKYSEIGVKVIQSSDPGSCSLDLKNEVPMNLERQFLSSSVGINEVETTYAVKLRSDLEPTNTNILKEIECKNIKRSRDLNYSFLQQRLLVLDVTSINPHLREELPFHPCDWVYAGLTEDLRKIFPINHKVDEYVITDYYKSHAKPRNNPFPNSTARIHSESYIFSEAIKRQYKLDFKHLSDSSNGNIQISEKYIFNNLYIVSMRKAGLKSCKHQISFSNYARTYSTSSWKKLGKNKDTRARADFRVLLAEQLLMFEIYLNKTLRAIGKLHAK